MRPLVLLLALAAPAAAFAADVEEQAKIQRDLDKAKAEVAKKYGDKKPGEMTPQERLQRGREENDAAGKVLKEHGTDAKSYERGHLKMKQDEQKAVNQKADELKKKDEADAAAKKAAKTEEHGIKIERGAQSVTPDEDDPFKDASPAAAPAKGGGGRKRGR